jgi:hypothetical protein
MMTTFYVIDFIYNLNDYAFFIKWLIFIFSVGPLNCPDRPCWLYINYT